MLDLYPLLLKSIPLLIIIPNIIAAHVLSTNNAYLTNKIYCFGYLLFIGYNIYINEVFQTIYFIVNWLYAVKGVYVVYKRKTL